MNLITICFPKKRMGLGCRKMGHLNKELLAKQFWRVALNQNCLFFKVLQAKNCRQNNIFSVRMRCFNFWGWEGILYCRNLVLTKAKWCVGDGKSIPFNHPAWFIMKEGVDNGLSSSVHFVADLIDQDGFCWKTFFIKTLYHPSVADEILRIASVQWES